MKHPRPRLGVSKCLEFEACRYNGVMISNDLVREMKPFVEFIPVCPEAEIGLGTPRPTVVLQSDGKSDIIDLYQPETDTIHTPEMLKLANDFVASNSDIDGFIFKSKSPSCGLKGVKVYHKASQQAIKASKGMFSNIISESYSLIALEEDGRLNDFQIREHFLIKLYTIARFKNSKKKKSLKELQKFHARHKLLFYCYNQNILRRMGRLVSDIGERSFNDVANDYESLMADIFSKLPTYKKRINALIHMLGYFKELITPKQKAHFLESIENYRNSRISAHTPLAIIETWLQAHDVPYLEDQYIFDPFPKEILFVADSGKGVKR